MASLKEQFHLHKDSFSIDPKRDAEWFFGRTELQQQVRDRIEQDFLAARRVPKFFLFGRYGAGKTHALAHVKYELENDDELREDFGKSLPRLTTLPPLKSKSGWATLHQHFIDELGRQMITDAALRVVQPRLSGTADIQRVLEDDGILRFGDTAVRASQAQIFRNLCFGGTQASLSWEWLKGNSLTADQAQQLNAETSLRGTPAQVHALLNTAALVAHGVDSKIVLLVDEGEALRDVTSADAQAEVLWALREIFDDDNDVLGMVVAFQVEGGQENIPEIFDDASVRTRVTNSGYIDLANLVPERDDVREFIRQVLAHLVDQSAAAKTNADDGLDAEPEDFPFTTDAIDELANYISEDPNRQIPRAIIKLMEEAVDSAYRRGRRESTRVLVDSELLERVLYPGEVD